MIAMYVTYAGDADTPFNREHWLKVHFPLVRQCWGPYGLEGLGAFFPPEGDDSGLIAGQADHAGRVQLDSLVDPGVGGVRGRRRRERRRTAAVRCVRDACALVREGGAISTTKLLPVRLA